MNSGDISHRRTCWFFSEKVLNLAPHMFLISPDYSSLISVPLNFQEIWTISMLHWINPQWGVHFVSAWLCQFDKLCIKYLETFFTNRSNFFWVVMTWKRHTSVSLPIFLLVLHRIRAIFSTQPGAAYTPLIWDHRRERDTWFEDRFQLKIIIIQYVFSDFVLVFCFYKGINGENNTYNV